MTRTTSPLLAAVVLLTAARPLRADEPPPVLYELQIADRTVGEVPRGGVVTVVGDALHECPPLPERVPGGPPPRNTCRHDELAVSLDGVPLALLLDCSRQRLTLIIPQETRPGRHALVVSVRGRGSAALDLEVVEPPPGCDPGEPEDPVFLQISRFELVHVAGAVQLGFTARTNRLPDGAQVSVTLLLHQRELDTRVVAFEDGQATTTFGPYDRLLPAGNYAVMAVFELSKQPTTRGARRRAFLRSLTPEERLVFERVERREFLAVDGVERQFADLRAHHLALVRDVDRLCAELDRWRATYTLAALRLPFGGRPPAIDVASFERWARTRLVPELDRVRRAGAEFDQRYAFPPEPRARALVERLGGLLTGSAIELSTRLGARFAVEPAIEPTPGGSSRAEFDSARRALLRAVGVTNDE